MQGPYLRAYGVATNVNFVLYGTSGKAFQTGAAFASADVKIMKDNGAEANSATGFADEGQGYSLPVSSSEMTASRVVIYVVDQSTKIWLDTNLVIETYGNPSAQHGFDLDSTTVDLGKILGSSSEATMLITVSSEVSDIAGKLPTSNLAGSTDIDTLKNVSSTDILTQVDIGLVARDLDHLINVDKAGVAPTSGSLMDLIMSKSTDQTFDQATDSLEAIKDAGAAGVSTTDILTQTALAMVAIDLDHVANVDKAGVAPTSGSLFDLVMNKSTNQTFSQANDALEALRDRGDVEWVTNTITTTDLLTQTVIGVNSATDINTIIAAVQGLKDISTTDVLTQVNLSTGVAGNFALVAGLKNISSTDVLTQSNAAMVNLNLDNLINIDALGTDPTTGTYLDLIMNKNGSQTFDKANDSLEAIRDRGDAEWITNILSTTDILTQVNLSTGVAGNFALVAGLKDISTTDVLTQVNLSNASTFDPSVDLINATLTYQKAMDDLTAESYGQVFKTSNAYQYLSSTGGVLFTLTVTSSDRTRTS